jgi:hypothetical protein
MINADCASGRGYSGGVGFSEAATQIAGVIEMSRWTRESGPVDGARVSLLIRFNLAAEKAGRTTPAP